MKTQREPAVLARRYLLQALLERSPVGMVWLATDTVLDRRVVVTLIDPRVAGDAGFRERLFANARALASSTAGTLVRLLDAGMDDDVPFIVTARLGGQTLAEVLERGEPFEPGRAADTVAGVLDGLAEAHAAGVLHLGLRPADVLLDAERVRLRNAGIVSAVIAGGPSAAAARYAMPPEGPPFDRRSDVWAAGALLFHLLARRPLAPGEPPAAALLPGVPKAIRTIVARALGRDPARRFPDAPSMARALRAATGARSADAERVRGATFRTWFAVPMLVAVVAAAVLAGGVWLGRLEIGGPVGIRLHEASPSAPAPAARPLEVRSVVAFDPLPGDGHENDDGLGYAIDGDEATVWRSENYFDGTLDKPGVGLLLDLGVDRTVTGFRLETPAPGFRFALVVGDDPAAMGREALAAPTYTAPDTERRLQPRMGRYALVWITSVVPTSDGYRAEVAEVRLFGTS